MIMMYADDFVDREEDYDEEDDDLEEDEWDDSP
jgi:hypothetical protein